VCTSKLRHAAASQRMHAPLRKYKRNAVAPNTSTRYNPCAGAAAAEASERESCANGDACGKHYAKVVL